MNKYMNSYIKLLAKVRPQLTDVSLRDGIQSALPATFPTTKKKELLHHIMTQTGSSRVEVGSLVSPKVLPIMADTLDVYRFGAQWCSNDDSNQYNARDSKTSTQIPRLGVLVPNAEKLSIALEHKIPYISMITSVSDEFQKKNIKRSLVDTKLELQQMCGLTRQNLPNTYLKLYISCINKCPIVGPISTDTIVGELLCYSDYFDVDELCLSDTCGTLSAADFKAIVDLATKYGVPVEKLSVHLHMTANTETEVQKILFYCFDKGIRKFDVSLVEEGGCSVTMGKQTKPNLTHETFFRMLNLYLRSKISE
jgi:hydroxymethylglutaryl-CoA lyase